MSDEIQHTPKRRGPKPAVKDSALDPVQSSPDQSVVMEQIESCQDSTTENDQYQTDQSPVSDLEIIINSKAYEFIPEENEAKLTAKLSNLVQVASQSAVEARDHAAHGVYENFMVELGSFRLKLQQLEQNADIEMLAAICRVKDVL